jgi:hypothetical protein
MVLISCHEVECIHFFHDVKSSWRYQLCLQLQPNSLFGMSHATYFAYEKSNAQGSELCCTSSVQKNMILSAAH